MIDWNKPLQTKSGNSVKIKQTSYINNSDIVKYVMCDVKNVGQICYHANGSYNLGETHHLDLINIDSSDDTEDRLKKIENRLDQIEKSIYNICMSLK